MTRVPIEKRPALDRQIRFVLPFTPRTKKTSNRVVKAGRFTKVLPSQAFASFRAECLSWAPVMFARHLGPKIFPIAHPVSVCALFYRDANRGDWCGYVQALGDILQDMGIIENDRQIQHFDGTRLALAGDGIAPSVEVCIRPEVSR